MKKTITVLESNENITQETQLKIIKKVAGYARVSTEKDEQFSSYSSQVDYYTNYINSRDDYKLVKVYTDEGISGTSLKNRTGFNEMIKDAIDGKIDLIITKSISRFARNTVDSLMTIRKLKEYNVEVYFEKENIYTLDSKGEFLITILSSLAQEKSRSISENVKWGIRKKLSDGVYTIHSKEFLGYDVVNGKIKINERESYIVKMIYDLFLFGFSLTLITNILNKLKLETPMNKGTWHRSVVKSILTNEKYIGDALLQKTYSTDFLTKKRIKNNGEVKSYYVKNGHEKIINKSDFKKVNRTINRLDDVNYLYKTKENFPSKFFKCSICGHYYIKSPYRNVIIYRCNGKYKENIKCSSVRYKETELIDTFNRIIDVLLKNKDIVKESLNHLNNIYNNIEHLLKYKDNLIQHNKYVNSAIIKEEVDKVDNIISMMDTINYLNNKVDFDFENTVNIIKENRIHYHFIDYILVENKNEYFIILKNSKKIRLKNVDNIYTIY